MEELKAAGVIFMPISEALREHPDLVRQYLGSVVPATDNYFATLNQAVFSDGSFVYIPPGDALPHGLVHLLPHQREEHRAVRAGSVVMRRPRFSFIMAVPMTDRGQHGLDLYKSLRLPLQPISPACSR